MREITYMDSAVAAFEAECGALLELSQVTGDSFRDVATLCEAPPTDELQGPLGQVLRRRTLINEVVLITGAITGFGRTAAEALAQRRYRVFATMRDRAGRNAFTAEALWSLVNNKESGPTLAGHRREKLLRFVAKNNTEMRIFPHWKPSKQTSALYQLRLKK